MKDIYKQVFSIVLVVVSTGCGGSSGPTDSLKETEDSRKYTLFASGDTMIARWVHYWAYEKGPAWMLQDVKELVSGADLAMTNLECVVSTRGSFFDKGEKRPYLYRARPEMLDILTEVGFDLVVTANNHAMDYGPEALEEQMELLESVGMAQVGSGRNFSEAWEPTYMQVDNIIIAFIGLETYFPSCGARSDRAGICHASGNEAILQGLERVIKRARRKADLVVFTPHWGANWTENPTAERVALAHEIIDLGVDAILGHSSHHLHGIEVYKGRAIVYDMGSFFFDTVGQGRLRFSAGFVLEFDKQGFNKLSLHPLRLHPSHTVKAKGEDLRHIQDLMIKLTRETDSDVEWLRSAEVLSIEMHPDPPAPARAAKPDRILETGRTIRLPERLRQRQTNVVFREPPAWTGSFNPVRLGKGVTVIGARIAEAVWPRCGFKAEVALEVSAPLNGRWIAAIKGIGRESRDTFIWDHPLADGGWLSNFWQQGQIVIDQTLVRPPRLSEGTYDLYWRLENRADKTVLPMLEGPGEHGEGFVRVGEILITSEGIPSGPAGVAWDGRRPGKISETQHVK